MSEKCIFKRNSRALRCDHTAACGGNTRRGSAKIFAKKLFKKG